MTLIFSAIFLLLSSPALAAPAAASTDNTVCSLIQQSALTQQNYQNDKVDSWLTTWWSQQKNKNSNSVPNLMAAQFLPNKGVNCPTEQGGQDNCALTAFSCANFQSKDAHAKEAWFAMNSMSNVDGALNAITAALDNVALSKVLDQYNMVSHFTQPAVAPTGVNIEKAILSTINTLLFVLSNFLPGSGIIITLGTGGIGQFSAALSSPESQAQLTLDGLSNFSNYIGKIRDIVNTQVNATKNALFLGNPNSNGKTIFDLISNGNMVPAQTPSTAIADASAYFQSTLTAGAINSLWKANGVYILGIPSPNCAAETRGPTSLKGCIPGDNSAYYVYMMSNKGGVVGHEDYPIVAPSGLTDQLSPLGLTVDQIVQSSVAAYRAAGPLNYANVQAARTNDAANWGKGNTPADKGAAFEGIWSIPVCYDSTAASISSIGATNRYPCLCGQNGIETGPFAVAAGFINNQRYQLKCSKYLQ